EHWIRRLSVQPSGPGPERGYGCALGTRDVEMSAAKGTTCKRHRTHDSRAAIPAEWSSQPRASDSRSVRPVLVVRQGHCPISVLILTRNEERDLPGCLQSVLWSDDVHVFDSLSTDRTVEIATALGAKVSARAFDGYASQRNAALRTLEF